MCYAFEYVISESIQLEPMRGRVTEFGGTFEDEPISGVITASEFYVFFDARMLLALCFVELSMMGVSYQVNMTIFRR